jgi:lipopolysaccharide export system permease protein
MNKLVFKKILSDYLIFFAITITSASVIVWVFQAVNFLDLMIEDGKGYLTYLTYSLLNFPKIVSKLFPFVLFFSFFYVLIKYENNNELLIFWNFGINKIQLIYFFFYFSLIFVVIQIFLTSILVPNSLKYSRDVMKNSNIDLFEGFIKPKKFNDTIKGLTIYTEDVMQNGDFVNVYIKKDTGKNSYQITFAKTGKLIIGFNNILELYNGETINNVNNKISKFQFQKSDFSLNNLESNILEFNKIQETPSLVLWSCLDQIFKTDIGFLKRIDVTNYNHNCNKDGLTNIFKELYKRYIIPFYIPILFLITLILIQKSKEEKNYNNLKIIIFLINFFIIILSETSLKFINNSIIDNTVLAIIPLITICILMLNFFYHFKWKQLYKK